MDFGLNHQQPKTKGHPVELNDREFLNPSKFVGEMGYIISSNCHGQITQLIQESRSSIMASMSV